VNVRLLAATRRDLDREVQAGRFRDDLFHRLAVARIELPPLRRRQGDVPLLADHLARILGGPDRPLPSTLVARWEDYVWPGNVRELRNAVARWLALGDDGTAERGLASITAASPEPAASGDNDFIRSVLEQNWPIDRARRQVIDYFDAKYIERVLEVHGGDVARAADASGIARRHFNRLRARSRG
jgi:DNA-binding NtrC family response regulator